jgi:NADH-quinone oxidoreductase subunit K
MLEEIFEDLENNVDAQEMAEALSEFTVLEHYNRFFDDYEAVDYFLYVSTVYDHIDDLQEELLMDLKPRLMREKIERLVAKLYEEAPGLFQIFDHSELWNVAEWTSYLTLSYLLFLIGISGIIFNYKNFLVTMLTIELMYLGVVAGFIITSVFYFDAIGQIYALITLILAASESAIGLGMLIVLFRYGRSIEFTSYQEMRG